MRFAGNMMFVYTCSVQFTNHAEELEVTQELYDLVKHIYCIYCTYINVHLDSDSPTTKTCVNISIYQTKYVELTCEIG